MSDHSHYGEYAEARHDHEGDYAAERHDHDLDYAEKHHRHYDTESEIRGVREELGRAEERIRELEEQLGADVRIRELEASGEQLAAILRQLADGYTQVYLAGMAGEAHLAIAEELAGAFHTLAGALRSRQARDDEDEEEPEPEPEEYHPGPECDDEGGMSEYRYVLPEDYERGQS